MEIKKIFENKKGNSNDEVYDAWLEFIKNRKKRTN